MNPICAQDTHTVWWVYIRDDERIYNIKWYTDIYTKLLFIYLNRIPYYILVNKAYNIFTDR